MTTRMGNVAAAFTMVALLAACGSSEPAGMHADAGVDAGMSPAAACACEESESCLECYEHIGRCCYEDETVSGQVHRLAENCERRGDCGGCCNECVEQTCEELLAGHACPATLPAGAP